MANGINVFIGGTDLLTGHLAAWVPKWKAQARSAASDIGNSLKSAFQVPSTVPTVGSRSGSLLFDVLGGNLLANLITGSVTTAVGMATQKIAQIQANLMDAAKLETATIASASMLSASLGINIEAAKKLTRDLRLEVVDIADAYIGDTQTYTQVFEQISPIVGELFKGNEAGFREAILDLTKRTGAIGATKGISGVESGSTIQRLLMGTMGVGEAMQQDTLQKTSLGKALYDSIARHGISTEDWKKLSAQTRFQIISDALKRVATDDMLAQFEDTTEGYLEVLKTRLFNPDVGIFGFLRGIEQANGRSVLDSFRGALSNIVKLWDTLAKVFAERGINFDPLLPLVRFFDWVSDMASGINRIFGESSKSGIGGLQAMKITIEGWIRDIPGTVANWLGMALNWGMNAILVALPQVAGAISGINWGAVGQMGRQFIDTLIPWVSRNISRLSGVIAGIDWGKVGASLLEGVWEGIKLLGYLIVNLPWGDIINILFVATSALRDALFGGLMSLLGNILEGLLWLAGKLVEKLLGLDRSAKEALDRFAEAMIRLLDSLTGWLPAPLRPSTVLGIPSGDSKDTQDTSGGMFGISGLPGLAGMTGVINGGAFGWASSTLNDVLGMGNSSPLPVPSTSDNRSSIFSPQINVTTQATDAQGTADEIMSQLGQRYESYRSTVLTR